VYRKLLLLMLLVLANSGAKGGPEIGVGPEVLKLKQGSGFAPTPLPHATEPLGVATLPDD
jgi:hypothetical protein